MNGCGPTLPGAGPSLRRWMRDVSYGVRASRRRIWHAPVGNQLKTFQILVQTMQDPAFEEPLQLALRIIETIYIICW